MKGLRSGFCTAEIAGMNTADTTGRPRWHGVGAVYGGATCRGHVSWSDPPPWVAEWVWGGHGLAHKALHKCPSSMAALSANIANFFFSQNFFWFIYLFFSAGISRLA